MIPPMLLFGLLSMGFLVAGSANILILSTVPYHSHNTAFLNLWKNLHIRDHNITFATSFPDDQNLVNFTVIDASAVKRFTEAKYTNEMLSSSSTWFVYNIFYEMAADIAENTLLNPKVQDLIHNHTRYKFDAIITELWLPSLFVLSQIYECPAIAVATIDVNENTHWHLGNQMSHVVFPDMNSGLFVADTFPLRTWNLLFTLFELIKDYWVYAPREQAKLDRIMGRSSVDVGELRRNIDLMLVNTNPFLRGVRALTPITVTVGGGNHMNDPIPLPQELQTYLETAENGFIYLSLGSIIGSKDLDENMLDIICEVLGRLPYIVLWKYDADHLPKKPKNVRLLKWVPQQDVLRHPNIKLFITQGGMQSLEEAIYTHVPVLVMPFFGDQYKNGQMVQIKGFGKMIQHNPYLDGSEFETNIRELIQNPTYKETAKRLARLMNDTYMTGLEKAVWWIEYVIRNNGTKELRSRSAQLPLYQYYALDVICFLLAVVSAIFYIMFMVVKKTVNISIRKFLTTRNYKVKFS